MFSVVTTGEGAAPGTSCWEPRALLNACPAVPRVAPQKELSCPKCQQC